MKSKYKIKEEKVSYVVGYSLDGNPEFSSSVRYIVYKDEQVAKYTDSDFKTHDAIFPTLELSMLFVNGKIGRLESRYVDVSGDAMRITKDGEHHEITCPNGDRYSVIETRWNDNKDSCELYCIKTGGIDHIEAKMTL